MLPQLVSVLLLGGAAAQAVVVDRVAVVARDRVIKDSDIEREIRLTAFINGDPLSFTPLARKSAASRLIDQTLLRREVEAGGYPPATEAEARDFLARIRSQRYPTDTAYRSALGTCGITEEQVLKHLAWQLTVLRFIDVRFRSALPVSEQELRDYYQRHLSKFQQAGAKPVTFESRRREVESELAGERINKEFYEWLDQARKNTRIEYREEDLK